jgi:hypothetical protein
MTFVPTRYLVSSITQASPAVVTTSTPNIYTTGQVIRFNIPPAYGMQELNNKLAIITVINNTTFSLQQSQVPPAVDLNSTNFQAFVNAGTGTPAAVVSVGSGPTPSLAPSDLLQRSECVSKLDDATTNVALTNQPF